MKIAMENHADFTVRELASILARVNSPAFGFTVDCANLAFDLDDPLRLAGIMAPYALTTHYKNYRIIRTPQRPGPGELLAGRRRHRRGGHRPAAWRSTTREINLNIEIHSQFAPFKLNILEDGFFARHPAPPGDGLAWYLKKSWEKPIPAAEPANLPDGPESWELEREHVELSVRWAREKLADVLGG